MATRTDPTLPSRVVPAPEPPPRSARAPRGRRVPWFLWVAGVAVLVPMVVPLVYLGWRVAAEGSQAWDIIASARTLELAINTVVLAAAVTAASAAIGVAVAWLTVRTDVPGGRVWGPVLALPLVIPSYVLALAHIAGAGPRGAAAELFGIGLPRFSGFAGAWLVLTIATYPYVQLIASASLARADRSFEEAARTLGAPPRRVFTTIVLPQLRPAVTAGALLAALYTISDFGGVSLMRFDTLTRAIYLQYQGRVDRSPAAVLAVVLIVIALAVVAVEIRTRGRAAYHGRRTARRPRRYRLSRWQRVTALGFLAAVAVASLVLPLFVLGFWLARGINAGESFSHVWEAAAGSLVAAGAAGLVAMVVAVPVTVLVVRHRSAAATGLERVSYAVHALPHLTVALAVVFFAANFLPAAYQSLGLLVVVYVAVFLPLATGAARTSLLQVDPSLEDASRSLGRGPGRTLAQVTVPLMLPGVLAGGALVFLTTMKELPATLLLRPTGYDTLAVRIWSATNELFYARAAAAALLLLAVSALPLFLLTTRSQRTT